MSLINGQATILGSSLDKSAQLVIQQEKQLPIETEDEAEVEITLGENGAIMEIDGSSLPKSWKDVADVLDQMRTGIAMIIGPTEVGKSALCTYLMNALLNRRRTVRVVDADIGQADVGPPTTIASSTPILPKPTLSSLDPDRMFFVGHNTPSFVQSQVIHGIKRMLNSDNNELTIINTDGWILGSEAIIYKNHLISTVKPDILVGIGSEDSLNPILHTTRSHSILVEPSRAVLQRTRSDRKELRKSGYRRFLNGSTVHTLKLNNVKMQLRKNIREALGRGNLDLRNVLLGFLTDKGFLDQIGILERMTPSYVTVYSKVIHEPVTFELGYVRLSRDGSELGFLD